MATIAELVGRCRFPDGHLDLAVSGGADSVAMAVLARASDRAFSVWHVDHELRPDSAADADFVQALAQAWGVPFTLCRVGLDVTSNVEHAARLARYGALPDGVCVAHTADDRAETVLLNLFRGAGLQGTAAQMAEANRPILALSRADTEAVCAEAGIEPRRDISNDDLSLRRNAVRRRLLPLISEIFDADPTRILNRHADLVSDALDVVQQQVADVDATDVRALRAVPQAVASEALRRWIQSETGSPYPVDHASIARVMAVVDGQHKAAEVTGGYRVARSQGRLMVSLVSADGKADP